MKPEALENGMRHEAGFEYGNAIQTESNPLIGASSSTAASYSQPTEDVVDAAKSGNDAGSSEEAEVVHLRKDILGYIFMALSALGFSGNALFIHYATFFYDFRPISAVFMRSIIQTLLSSLLLFGIPSNRRTVATLTTSQTRLLIFRGVVGTVSLTSLYVALSIIPLGDTIAIFFVGPAFTFAFSHVFIGEPFTLVDMFALVISIIGAIFITHPDTPSTTDTASTSISPTQRLIGGLYTLVSAALSGVVYTTVRYLGSSIHYLTSVFSFGFFAMIGSALMGGIMTLDHILHEKEGTLFVVCGSLCAFFGQVFLNKGLQLCRAGPALLVRNLEVPFGYIAGILLLNEQPSWIHAYGASLIVFSALFIGVREAFDRFQQT